MSIDFKPHIFITGDMGSTLPPPFGGIMKRTLLHAKNWRERGANITVHVYAKKGNRDDLGASAEYIYDFPSEPGIFSKIGFIVAKFVSAPFLFMWLFKSQLRVASIKKIPHILYACARGVLINTYFKKNQPDAVVTETAGFQSYAASLIARKHTIPLILIHSAEILLYPEYGVLWREELSLADAIISTSKHCAKGPQIFMDDKNKMHLIYSGVNFELFSKPLKLDKTVVRTAFGISSEKFVILSIGSLHVRKGHDQLMRALLTLPEEQRRNMLVVLCGTGSANDMWEKADALHFPRESLRILEKLPEDEMARLYSVADCFCFPSVSDRECMGLALKEALSAGLPIAAYRSGGIPEAVVEGINGFLAEPNDVVGLATAISSVQALSEADRIQLKQVNQDKARELFDIRSTSEQVYSVIQREIARVHQVD